MRAVLATYGTMGDVVPVLALGGELRRKGHSVVIAASPDFRDRADASGLEFAPLGPSLNRDELRQLYGSAIESDNFVEQVRMTLPTVIREAPRMTAELADACTSADVLVSLPYQLAGQLVHELHQVPFATVHLSPFGGYSRRFAEESARWINELRHRYGLHPVRDPLGVDGASSTLSLYAVSPRVFHRPKRWPEHHRLTGFFFLDEAWVPDEALERFLASGDRPIVVTFGSLLHRDPRALASILLEGIHLAGVRAIVQRGWTELDLGALPPTIHVADVVPHGWLFPRAACVVHAGGAGTTAACLRAGVPSVVVPHWLDQFLWANIARERECASDVIRYSELTANRLAKAIEEALGTQSFAEAARAMALQIRAEDGVACAAELIEAKFATRPYQGRSIRGSGA
jgi:UDP:flavonoid glycosyltransferase YjiC (YdhE family)